MPDRPAYPRFWSGKCPVRPDYPRSWLAGLGPPMAPAWPRIRPVQPSSRSRRALELIACAAVAALVAGAFYLHGSPPTARPVPAAEPSSVLNGPYAVAYAFVGPSVGWALVTESGYNASGFRIFKTTDGAASWRELYTGDSGGGDSFLNFFDEQHGVFVAGSTYRTVDGGETWRPVEAGGSPGNVIFE